jgi:hypothetical protein
MWSNFLKKYWFPKIHAKQKKKRPWTSRLPPWTRYLHFSDGVKLWFKICSAKSKKSFPRFRNYRINFQASECDWSVPDPGRTAEKSSSRFVSSALSLTTQFNITLALAMVNILVCSSCAFLIAQLSNAMLCIVFMTMPKLHAWWTSWVQHVHAVDLNPRHSSWHSPILDFIILSPINSSIFYYF